MDKDYLFHVLFKNNQNIMLLVDPDSGEIIEANQAAINFYGYPADEIQTMRIQDINILSEKQIYEKMNHAVKEGEGHYHFTHKLANNELKEVEIYSFPVELDKRELLVSTVYDISEKVEQKLMLDTLFFNSPYAVVTLGKNQKIVNINENFTRLFQYNLEEAKGNSLKDLIAPHNNQGLIGDNLRLVYQGEVIKQDGVRKTKEGKLINVETLAYPIINNNKIIGVCVIYIDITHKRAYERQLHLFRKVLENNNEGVVITNIDGEIEWTNRAFKEITGYSFDEVIGKNMSLLKSGIHDKLYYQEMWAQITSTGSWSGEIWNKNKDGNIYAEWLNINSIRFNSNTATHYVGVFKDLSEKKLIDRRISELQQKDQLTNLNNKDYFLENAERYIKTCNKDNGKFAILSIDIEGLRDINDSIGHLVGDRLIVELSKRLSSLTGDNNILSRFNGVEFIILYKDINKQDLNIFIEELLNFLKKPYKIGNNLLYIGVNIGISKYPENGTDAETLVRYADVAMSKAKSFTDEKVCFYTNEMSEEIEMKFHINNHLVGAIRNNEFTIHYQPIFDINKEKSIKGAEALLRWTNPILGSIPPTEFIPLAEKTGQILSIGEWVLDQVCKQINKWEENGYKISPISVNASVKQLEQVDFSNVVIRILRNNNIKPDDIEFEITESISSGDIPTIINNIRKLKDIGIKISMDDFGTGFSSLGQLDIFELDKLKIDKVFIDDLVNVTKRQNLVKSIIAMANSLDLTVVAEGIETAEQLLYLRKLGCQLGQGHLFSKPIPAEGLQNLMDTLA